MADDGSSVSSSSTDQYNFASPVPAGIFKGVVAYVEVRTASDNRSKAIMDVLKRMGARVEDKFTNDVTHVIFKEGKKRTRDKALRIGAHLVSVLWVDSCKRAQRLVPEIDFLANTEKCGTPPPGVRWKKCKSMQPTDFADDVARSAERCEKKQKRMNKYQRLLQGDLKTPFHPPSRVLVVDTQPRTPQFCSQDFMAPVIIPCTPPSMLARLDQLALSREARRTELEEGPRLSNNEDPTPLPRKLFRSEADIPHDDSKDKSASRRRSSRLSVLGARDRSRNGVGSQGTSFSDDGTGWVTDSEANTTVFEDTDPHSEMSANIVLPSQTVNKNGCHRTRTSPETSLPTSSQPTAHMRQARRSGENVPCESSQKTSQKDDHNSQREQQRARRVHVVPSRKGEKISSDGACVRIQKRKRRSSSHSCDRVEGDADGNTTESSSQDTQRQLKSAGLYVTTPKPKKRKLLNPSQDMHILSPSPSDNAKNVEQATSQAEKRGKKRKTWDVDDVFPSSFPARRRSCRLSQSKENRPKRGTSPQTDLDASEQSVSQSCAGNKKNNAAKNKTIDTSASTCSLSSTSQMPSMLGSSMSVIFDSTSSEPWVGRFLPPRSSIAEFRVRKTGRKAKKKASTDTASQAISRRQNAREAKLTSFEKFRLRCMPSLVMTSLHRQEQDVVISAVKSLGVFRIEDKVSQDTTHVVCGESRRTLNLLHGIARGCWVLSKEWVLRSVEHRCWQSEGDFEIADDIPAVKEARLAREAVAPGMFHCTLFETVGTFFVSNTCTPPRTQLVKLLQLCGAKVTDSINRADFYLGDETHEDKNSIKPVWVLDCITQLELLPMEDYILAINHRPKPGSSPEF